MWGWQQLWQDNVKHAQAKGQKLIVYTLRDWENRVEPVSKTRTAQENRNYAFGRIVEGEGKACDIKKGDKMRKFVRSQAIKKSTIALSGLRHIACDSRGLRRNGK